MRYVSEAEAKSMGCPMAKSISLENINPAWCRCEGPDCMAWVGALSNVPEEKRFGRCGMVLATGGGE